MINIAVLVSGGGTNLQALIDFEKAGNLLGGKITLVISSKEDVFALERAKNAGIDTCVIAKKQYNCQEAFDQAMLNILESRKIGLIVLAGYLNILSSQLTSTYENRIINVHPSLIPSFCGDGYYGLRVHEAALKCGVKLTGATVHFVNEVTDGGAIILQKCVKVLRNDTPHILQRRVMEEAEWEILPQAVSLFCQNRLEVVDGKVWVKDEI
jgi:phosphoribosylglycinamide formyltransferase-1